MFNSVTLNESVPFNRTSVLLSALFSEHPMPNTNYIIVSVSAVNIAGVGSRSMAVITIRDLQDGTYCTYVIIQ